MERVCLIEFINNQPKIVIKFMKHIFVQVFGKLVYVQLNLLTMTRQNCFNQTDKIT